MKLIQTLAVLLTVLAAGCSGPPSFKSTDITGGDWGKNFAMADHRGQPRQLSDFRGKAVVLFFGYTHCPDVCPTTLATLADVMKSLGEDAARVQVVFVTLDPARDTAQLLQQYVPAFHPSFIGLRGDDAATVALAKEFKVFFARQPGKTADTYSIDHSTGSYAFDPAGRLRLVIRHGETSANIAADLKQLLAGK